MRSIKELKDLKGKRVFVRIDFNAPIMNGKVVDGFKITKTLPTVQYLVKKGAKVILATHLSKEDESVLPVAKFLSKHIKVKFIPEVIGDRVAKAVSAMKNGEVILLENLRKESGEKNNDKIFALSLSKLGDLYVNEAFPVDHREDASLVMLPKMLPAYAGLQLQEEVKNLSAVFNKPKHPFMFILGGSKFSTKIPLLKKYLKLADYVFVGGALLNDLLKAKGYEVGKSLVDDSEDSSIKAIIKNKKLILPEDVMVRGTKAGSKLVNKKINEVSKDDVIIDMGTNGVHVAEQYIKKSKLVLWNGPLGKYEDGGDKATKQILKSALNSKAQVVIGGGDIVAVISSLKSNTYKERPGIFISTGGGATLDFLTKGTLPGIEVLR